MTERNQVTPLLPSQARWVETDTERLWMRGHYSFVQLREIAKLLLAFSEGLKPMELNRLAQERGIAKTNNRTDPSPTTLYHCRRALLNLGIVKYEKGRLVIARENRLVANLIPSLGNDQFLTLDERRCFSELVVTNHDCQGFFFDMFMLAAKEYDLTCFIKESVPVVWKSERMRGKRCISFSRLTGELLQQVTTEIGIQAILYGMRYWARDHLLLIDEFYREDIGNIMYPIGGRGRIQDDIVWRMLLQKIVPEQSWTVLSTRDLLLDEAIALRIGIRQFWDSILRLYRRYPGYVVFIPTSRRMATVAAASVSRENLELRGYFQDEAGRFVSHIRLYSRLREEQDGAAA